MRTLITGIALVAACGSSVPIPNDQYAAAQKNVGRAQESGATDVPEAKLHTELAQEDLAQAKQVMDKDNARAASLIARANAEAELAVSLAKAAASEKEAKTVSDDLAKAKQGGK
jgi:hypothetical protein